MELIYRFCLYGFLKNQRYFETFWILAFIDKGLSFAAIGALIGFRQICVTILEVPTGAIADVVGRRWAMIFSHLAYVFAFLAFGFTQTIASLFVGMFAFAIGEAFRTGTHKAMIFAWLKSQGREKEKTEFYGLTRSWSQMGSAVSTVIAASLVFALQNYSAIFWLSAIPTSLNIINFLGYPKELDGKSSNHHEFKQLFAILWKATVDCFRIPQLRRPIIESMGFEGMYGASKDYLQPIVHQMVLALPLFTMLNPTSRTAVLIAAVYTTLYLLSSMAACRAGRMARWLGGDVRAARALWILFGASFGLLLTGTLTAWMISAVVGLIALAVLQNMWRPILVSRIAEHADEAVMATVLSVESQSKSLGMAILAPLIGLTVDRMPTSIQFAPIAVWGILIAVVAFLTAPAHADPNSSLKACVPSS